MAYNYYQPTGYPMYNSPQTNSGIVWVNDYNDAAMYPIAPNAAVALWDKNSPCIYLKQADSTGRPSLKIFDLVERKPKEAQEPRYATVEALQTLSDKVEGIIAHLNSNGLKSNLAAFKEGEDNNA